MASKKISALTDRVTITGTELIPVAIGGLNYSITPTELKTFIASSALTITNTDDSTNKDTGCLILNGGLGVEKSFGLGANLLFEKEVNHTIKISDATTASTQGSVLTVQAGKGTATYGGELYLKSGGLTTDTGTTGSVYIYSEDGRTSGDLLASTGTGTVLSGFAALATGSAPISGPVNIYSGNASAGVSGDVFLDCGSSTSTTVSSKIRVKRNIVRQHLNQTIATGNTLTGKQLVDGYIAVTGGTGNVTLPTCAQISTAINNGSSVTAGVTFDFCVNAVGMTASNTVTLVVGANMSVASAPAVTGGDSLTLTQDTQVIGWWRITFITTTTCKIQRIA